MSNNETKWVSETYLKFRNMFAKYTRNAGVESMDDNDLLSDAYLMLHEMVTSNPDVVSLDQDNLGKFLSYKIQERVRYWRSHFSKKCRTLESDVPEWVYPAVADGLSLNDGDVHVSYSPADQNLEFTQCLEQVYALLNEDEQVLFDLIQDPADEFYDEMDKINFAHRPSQIPGYIIRKVLSSKLGRSVSQGSYAEMVTRIREAVSASFDRVDLLQGLHNVSAAYLGVSSSR